MVESDAHHKSTSATCRTTQSARQRRLDTQTDRGTFWFYNARKPIARLSAKDCLIFVNDSRSVFKRRNDIVASQLRVTLQNSLRRVAASNHTQDISHQDARSANHRLSATNGRIDLNAIHGQRLQHSPIEQGCVLGPNAPRPGESSGNGIAFFCGNHPCSFLQSPSYSVTPEQRGTIHDTISPDRLDSQRANVRIPCAQRKLQRHRSRDDHPIGPVRHLGPRRLPNRLRDGMVQFEKAERNIRIAEHPVERR